MIHMVMKWGCPVFKWQFLPLEKSSDLSPNRRMKIGGTFHCRLSDVLFFGNRFGSCIFGQKTKMVS